MTSITSASLLKGIQAVTLGRINRICDLIDHAWGLFMVEQGTNLAKSLYATQQRPDMQGDVGRAYIALEYQKLERHMLQAHAYMTGTMHVRDHVEAEATLRMYYQRSRPH